MDPVLTSAQMRQIEGAAIGAGRVSGLDLMRRAAAGVVAVLGRHWGDAAGAGQGGAAPVARGATPPRYLCKEEEGAPRHVVLCGPGNNGGDGYEVARLLHEAGHEVAVFGAGDPDGYSPEARATYQGWAACGPVAPLGAAAFGPGDLVIDALFGTGLTRPVAGVAAEVLARLAASDVRAIVAVDAPSGLCLDSGRVLGGAVLPRADLTVTFEALKRGHLIDAGAGLCGPVAVVDLGLGPEMAALLRQDGPAVARAVGAPAAADLAKHPAQHKFDHGHALVLSGPPGKGGAARLAAMAALRIGAGLVSIVAPRQAHPEMAAQLTAIMLADSADLPALLDDPRITALCVGPGFGLDAAAQQRFTDFMGALSQRTAPLALVLDADALTLMARDPTLTSRLRDLPRITRILTPHAGEFARLAPDLAESLRAAAPTGPAPSRLAAAEALAERLNGTLLLKGADTLIASPGQPPMIHAAHHDAAAPWLATAGSGDVLAGLVTGLAARGLPPGQAAAAAAWIHADAARRFGPGLIAEDLPAQIPETLRDLGV